MKKNADNTSGFKGVTWNKAAKKWQAQSTQDGRTWYLGIYASLKKAHEAYRGFVLTRRGEFAYY